MRIHTALLSSTLLAMLTSCAGTPANDDVNMPFGAAPMGEVATAQPASPCLVMSPQTMRAPSRAKITAVARPMPLPAPVIAMVLPLK